MIQTSAGTPRYNLSCENDLTVLHLYSGRYYVLAINYKNGTIRVVDARFQKGNCSSLPHYSLAKYNFSYEDPYRTYQRRGVSWRDSTGFELSKPIIFMTCGTWPGNISSLFVDTAPCITATRGNSIVDTRESLNASDLLDSCRIELMVLTSWNGTMDLNRSYMDIHNELLFGFELSWLHNNYRRPGERCYIDTDTDKVNCTTYISASLLRVAENYLAVSAKLILSAVIMWTGTKVVLGVPCVIVFLILKWKRRHLSMYGVIEEFLQSHNNIMPIRYSYSEIKKMTKAFEEKLGEGGYGSVYKGKLRSRRLVAVKMLGKSKANGQDFMNEVATIGRMHHVNVVQLIGYCAEGSKRALIYEYMSNGSLDKHIFSKEGSISLSCKEAFEISVGVARCIGYLHQGCDMKILHFDIKPHNILLDENFVPKVSDFGLARLCPLDDSSSKLSTSLPLKSDAQESTSLVQKPKEVM